MKIVGLSKIEKLKLIGQCIKAGTGIIGGSLVLVEGHPYTATVILALGAISAEVVSFIKEKENKQILEVATDEKAEQ
jgi:aerobic-type carbon monoxide dehydrogenase small subunit (CoxS/CutS family)